MLGQISAKVLKNVMQDGSGLAESVKVWKQSLKCIAVSLHVLVIFRSPLWRCGVFEGNDDCLGKVHYIPDYGL